MTKDRSRLLRRVALVAIGLAVGVGLAELVARRLPAGPGRHYIESDPVLHHRLRKNLSRSVHGVPFTTNSLGLRDREYPSPKPAGVFRVLMLGDSFTEGAGLPIEETVAKRSERLFNTSCAGAYEVVNAGTGSYSPILEYLQLKHLGLALEPDLVVLNFDMTDVHDDYIRTFLATLDANGLPLSVDPDRRREAAWLMPPLPKAPGLGFLDPVEAWLNRSGLYQEFRRSWIGKRLVGGLQLTPERLEARGLVGDVRYDPEVITRGPDFPRLAEAWQLTARYIVGIGNLARAHGASFALVVYPHAQQVSAAESPAGRARMGLGPGLYDSERPFQILEDLGRRDRFPVINLLGLFREREKTDAPLFRHDDIHHTLAGARVFAEGVANGIREHRLIPCAPR